MARKPWVWPLAALVLWVLVEAALLGDLRPTDAPNASGAAAAGTALADVTNALLEAALTAWPVVIGAAIGGLVALANRDERPVTPARARPSGPAAR